MSAAPPGVLPPSAPRSGSCDPVSAAAAVAHARTSMVELHQERLGLFELVGLFASKGVDEQRDGGAEEPQLVRAQLDAATVVAWRLASHQTVSNAIATDPPPPRHSVARPYRPPRRSR